MNKKELLEALAKYSDNTIIFSAGPDSSGYGWTFGHINHVKDSPRMNGVLLYHAEGEYDGNPEEE